MHLHSMLIPSNQFNSSFISSEKQTDTNWFLGNAECAVCAYRFFFSIKMKNPSGRPDPTKWKWSQFNFIGLWYGLGVLPIPKRERNKFGTETHISEREREGERETERSRESRHWMQCSVSEANMVTTATSTNNTQMRSHISVDRSEIKIYAFVFVCRRYNCVIGYRKMWHTCVFFCLSFFVFRQRLP